MASKVTFQVKVSRKKKSPPSKVISGQFVASKTHLAKPLQTRNQNVPANETKSENNKKVQNLKPLMFNASTMPLNIQNQHQMKAVNSQNKQINTESKQIKPQVKPINPGIKPFTPQNKTINSQIQPLIPQMNPGIKPFTPQLQPMNGKIESLNPQIKPVKHQVEARKSAGKRNGMSQLQKRSFISEQEMMDMLGGIQIDSNNNVRGSQESLNTGGSACLVHIAKVYAAQQHAFDKLEGSRLVEDVLLRGKLWRDTLNHAESCKDSIVVYGLKVTFHCPSTTDMSKKRFFACIHLHNALRNFGIRSALAVHIDISRIKHRRVAEISRRMMQLVGDGYNFFAYQFKVLQTQEAMRRIFNEPGAYGVYIGFAFILDYVAYRNKCKKAGVPVAYDIKQYVEAEGDRGCVVRGIDKSSGSAPFEFEVSQDFEDLSMEYVGVLFNGVRFT